MLVLIRLFNVPLLLSQPRPFVPLDHVLRSNVGFNWFQSLGRASSLFGTRYRALFSLAIKFSGIFDVKLLVPYDWSSL